MDDPLTGVLIDWSWPERTAAERQRIEGWEDRVDSFAHPTRFDVTKVLTEASSSLEISVEAVIELETRRRVLPRAAAGRVEEIPIKDVTQRGDWAGLPLATSRCQRPDHSAGRSRSRQDRGSAARGERGLTLGFRTFELPNSYTDEAQLRGVMKVVSAYATEATPEMVADVLLGGRRFPVRLRPGETEIVPLIPWPKTEAERDEAAVSRILGADPHDLFPRSFPESSPDSAPTAAGKSEVELDLSSDLLDRLARGSDESISSIWNGHGARVGPRFRGSIETKPSASAARRQVDGRASSCSF